MVVSRHIAECNNGFRNIKKPKQRGSLLGLFDKLLLGFIWVVIGSLIDESLGNKGFQRFDNRIESRTGHQQNPKANIVCFRIFVFWCPVREC